MAPIVLLLGAGAALLLLKAVGGSGLAVGKTPAQERALLLEQDGWHYYQVDYQPMLTQRLKVMSLNETGDPALGVMVDAGEIVPDNASAFTGARALHSIGFNIWVSPTLLSKTKQARWLYAAKEDEVNDEGAVGHPPASWKGKLALLALASNPFPDVAGMPPPPPATPPPPPDGV